MLSRIMAMKGDTPNEIRPGMPGAGAQRFDDGGLARDNLTLRDDFAKAVIGNLEFPVGEQPPDSTLYQELAKAAYAVADAMLLARTRKGG